MAIPVSFSTSKPPLDPDPRRDAVMRRIDEIFKKMDVDSAKAWAEACALSPGPSVTGNPDRESDPTGRAPSTPGAKLDAGKAPILRGAVGYFPRALAAVAMVSEHGAKKYTWKGWETVPDGINRYGDALMRHLCSEHRGEVFDQDSQCMHAAHAAWNALARLELTLREKEVRP